MKIYIYKFLNTNEFDNKINKYIPTIILFKDNNNYYPIFNENYETDEINKKSIFLYSQNKDLLYSLYDKFNVFIEGYKYKKTLAELKKISVEMGINIKKKSENTGKEIYLKKSELLDKIRKSYIF